jgi:ATP-binding cassette subfamily C protein
VGAAWPGLDHRDAAPNSCNAGHLAVIKNEPMFDANLLKRYKQHLWFVFALSGFVNLLMLTGAIYMLQVYDRVLPSKSGVTLVYLTFIMLILYTALHLFDDYRQKITGLVGRQIEEELSSPLFRAALELPLRYPDRDRFAHTIRDLEEVGRLLTSGAIVALFDLPWMPIFIIVCFMFHPLIGFITLASIALVIALTIVGELKARRPADEVIATSRQRHTAAYAAQRQAEVIAAMGFGGAVTNQFASVSERYHAVQSRLSHLLTTIGGLTRTSRMVVQSLLLGVGAWLVINDLATGGVMIAASIISARALGPIDMLVSRWRSIIMARDSWRRVQNVLALKPPARDTLTLPMPTRNLTCEDLSVTPVGGNATTVRGVSFALSAGDGFGIIGPSGSGKTTLLRGLLGIWRPTNGVVKLDGAPVEFFDESQRGGFVGYLPQDVQLLRGTVAQNIARFAPAIDSDAIIRAAQLAGVHEMILNLPDGYDCDVGEDGLRLSGGQRQRIGLARALYRDPFLLVLDEPNSNLDSAGEQALTNAMRSTRARGGIVIIVAHRLAMLKDVNKLLLLIDGNMKEFGNRDDVLASLKGGGDGLGQRADTGSLPSGTEPGRLGNVAGQPS